MGSQTLEFQRIWKASLFTWLRQIFKLGNYFQTLTKYYLNYTYCCVVGIITAVTFVSNLYHTKRILELQIQWNLGS
jgi:hypothetical protein